MYANYLSKIISFVVGAALSSTAMAATITFDSRKASWTDGTPSANVTTYGSDTANPRARWGSGIARSGYDFLAVDVPLNVDVPVNSASSPFELGTFTHLNRNIAGGGIQSIDLKLSTWISVDGMPISQKNFVFTFQHLETNNNASHCANGEANGTGVNVNGCADRVTIRWQPTSDSFLANNVEYTLNIIGFTVDGGLTTVEEFWTVEKKRNDAILLAQISADTAHSVPEPASLALMGLGLAGLAGLRLRRRALRPV